MVAFFQLFPIVVFASPYQLKPYKVITSAAVGASLGIYGLNREKQLGEPSEAELSRLDKADVFVLDRLTMGKWNRDAQNVSDFFLKGSPLAVLPIFIDKQNDFIILGSMYLEAVTLTIGGTYFSKGVVKRYRPYAYGEEAPLETKLRLDTTRSFFSGHTSSTSMNFIFAAKTFADYYPQSEYVPYVWGAAIAGSLTTGALRMAGGMHFLTDVLAGFAWGGGMAYWITESHKKQKVSLDFRPFYVDDIKGMNVSYVF